VLRPGGLLSFRLSSTIRDLSAGCQGPSSDGLSVISARHTLTPLSIWADKAAMLHGITVTGFTDDGYKLFPGLHLSPMYCLSAPFRLFKRPQRATRFSPLFSGGTAASLRGHCQLKGRYPRNGLVERGIF
jgi:hypothetical protein